MRPIVMLMFAVDFFVVLTTALAITRGWPRPNRRGPVWSRYSIMLVMCAAGSWSVGQGQVGDPNAVMLQDVALVLLGMTIMAIFMAIRERRELESVAP